MEVGLQEVGPWGTLEREGVTREGTCDSHVDSFLESTIHHAV